MLSLILMLATGVGASADTPQVPCALARAALQDLPAVRPGSTFDSYYAAPVNDAQDVVARCRQLMTALPNGYAAATDDARRRAAIHAPQPGKQERPAYIYSIRLLEFSLDRRTAYLRIAYECSGLCGGYTEVRYVLDRHGWRRDGAPRGNVVS